jgi:hypothetical protein
MIVVRIELWPGGDKNRSQLLGVGVIANDGAGSTIEGNYKYQIFGKKNVPLRAGKVTGFPRKQLLGWDLLCRVLKQAFGDRN